ncbi:hypothetical protein TNCV_1664541 [Trichonephila clavipes]|uniref:Uncharacterized protein n=1 Tax=Trichonephila clavipes TaxID=2585209 RepID=A0A8X6RX43_TRICX|nr:hypothetical protein TNCV_1664541 [Trichonephila clavipes]
MLKSLSKTRSGVTENIRASLQSQILDPKTDNKKGYVFGVSQALGPLEIRASSILNEFYIVVEERKEKRYGFEFISFYRLRSFQPIGIEYR